MKIIVYINFVLTLIIIGFLGWKETVFVPAPTAISPTILPTFSPTPNLPTPKEIIKIITVTPTPSKIRNQTTYIPIIGPISTTSSGWYDAPGTDFYFNIADYGKNSYITWESSLKVADGNGTAYARLFDVTHGIGVNGSEVFVANKSDLTQVYSSNLSFWANNNLYRVQIKSLNTFEVTFGGGRIKIIY